MRIGFVTCVHPLYDLASVVGQRQEAVAELRKSGCEVIAAEIPRSSLDAIEIAASLRKCEIDLAVLFFCSWVAEDVTLALARELMDIPMLLWALPYLDREIPMPSPISGLTGSGSNIRRLGKRFTYVIGGVAAGTVGQVARAARAGAAARALRRARFGVVGYPCPGMIDVGVDEADLQKALGVTTRPDTQPDRRASQPAGLGGWIKLFANEGWYKQQPGPERLFTGELKAIKVDPDMATTLQRTS